MNESFEDDQLRKMISESRIEMPFKNFEKDLMVLIKAENQRRRYIQGNIKLSWFFFGFGLVSGILITIFLSRMEELILGIDPELVVILIVFCLSAIFLLLVEKLVKFTLFNKEY